MNDRKFKIGQLVYYKPRPSGLRVPRVDHPAGAYQIAQLMPPVGDEPQYRIKSEAESHLRVAQESELSTCGEK
jgi:hypothetical protein